MMPGIFAGAMGTNAGPSPPSTYEAEVLSDNPALYLRFAENVSGDPANSGSVSLSSSSYNNSARGQASLCGDPGDYSVGISTGAGTRGPTAVYSANTVGKANDFVVEAIIYPTSLASDGAIYSADQNGGVELRIISGKINLIRRATAVVAIASTTLSTNTRYHVACRIASDGTYTFFLNGVTDGTGAGFSSFNGSETTSQIGFESLGGNVFVGRIDELAYYRSALSDARIAAHAAAMAP